MPYSGEENRPWITDDFGKKITVEAHIYAIKTLNKYEDRIYQDPLLCEMRDQGAMDPQYMQVIQPI